MVLMALAVIFLPSLFHRDERQQIDTVTQIPPSPVFEPVTIPKPVKPEGIKQPDIEKLFQPQTAPNLQNALKLPDKPELTESGVPIAWVVQAARAANP